MPDAKLQKVLTLQQSREQKAAGTMQKSREQRGQLQQQLTQLHQYRDEYEALFRRTSVVGIDARILEDYRLFLAKLNEAIERQQDQIGAAQQRYQQSRSLWTETWLRKEALSQLLGRNRARNVRCREKAEQKVADERSGLALKKD